MPERDRPLAIPGDLAAALALLTRLPVPANITVAQDRGAAAAWAYPLAGVAVGLFAGIAGLLTSALGLPATAVAGVILLTSVAVTGALHEDGLADTCDGLWGAWQPARRLEIMQDSRIGTYGVLALILALGLRWTALAAIIASGSLIAPVLAAAILSRAPMVVLMYALPNARQTGLSRSTGRPSARTAGLAVGIALVLGMVLLGAKAIPVALILTLATLAVAAIARAKIGGQTGDILGATQQIGEIVVLLSLSAGLAGP